MQAENETASITIPNDTTCAWLIYSVGRTLSARQTEYDQWMGLIDLAMEDFDVVEATDCLRYAQSCKRDIDQLKNAMRWANEFRATCLSLYSNLPVSDQKKKEENS